MERTRRRLNRTGREYLVVWNDRPFRRSSRENWDVFLFKQVGRTRLGKRTMSRSLERTVRLAVQEQRGGLSVGIELALTEQDEVVLSLARGEIPSIVFEGRTRDRSVQKQQSYLVVRKGQECLVVGIRRGSLGSLQERAGGRSNCYSQRRLLVRPVAETCRSIRTGLSCCSGRKKAACSTRLGLSRSRSEGWARGSTRSERVLDDGDGRMLLRIVGNDNGGECLIVRLVDPHDGKVVRGVDSAPEMAVKVRNLWGSCRRKPCER